VRQLRDKLSGLPDTQVTAETSGYGDEGTDRMRDQFYALQVREKEAQAKYTEDHPKMRQIRDQVAPRAPFSTSRGGGGSRSRPSRTGCTTRPKWRCWTRSRRWPR